MLLSLYVLAQERVVAAAENRVDLQTAALAAGKTPPAPPADPLPLGSAPRALLADALLRSRAAQSSGDDFVRNVLLDQASAELDSIRSSRPYWGELWASSAFVHSLRQGEDSPEARIAFGRSYEDAPYLMRAGSWRVAYGFNHWDNLSEVTRGRVVNEAVWLSRSSNEALDTIMTLARQSPAYQAYMVRWIQSREGDADFRPFQPMTP